MPKVSICIPAYNQVKYLKRTIDSILSQSFTDYEIIITDDSPTQIVYDLVKQYQDSDKIKYYKNPIPLGSPENWNESIKKASGEFIKIMHHDDWFTYDYSLAEFVNLLEQNPNIDFAFSGSFVLFEDGKNWVHSISNNQFKNLSTNPLIIFSGNLIGAPSAVIYRKKNPFLFDRNLKWLVDIEFYLRKINGQNVFYTAKDLVTTFGAEGRVTDNCFNNKNVEIFENFYLLEKVQHDSMRYSKTGLAQVMLHVIAVCNKYSIRDISDIRNCNYKGRINSGIRMYFILNKISNLLGHKFLLLLKRNK